MNDTGNARLLCPACDDDVPQAEADDYDGYHLDCFQETHCDDCEEETDVNELLSNDGKCETCAQN